MEDIIEVVEIAESAEVVDPPVEKLIGAVEALLFAAHEPLAPSTLISLNGHTGWTLDDVIAEINRRLESGQHPLRVRKVAGGYQMHVLPEYGPIIESVLVKTKTQRLSRAGLETLAIIAYRQPCSTPELEHIRGVAADGVIRTLLERDLITIKGRSEGPGRPLLYGTTGTFLRYFGLNAVEDLPREEELSALLAERSERRMREEAAAASDGQQSFTLTRGPEIAEDTATGRTAFRIRDVMLALSAPGLN
jgi:segregation and condensation protein B